MLWSKKGNYNLLCYLGIAEKKHTQWKSPFLLGPSPFNYCPSYIAQ